MTKVIKITVSDAEKEQLDHLFQKMGMSVGAAGKIFYMQSLMEHALPFQPQIIEDNFNEEKLTTEPEEMAHQNQPVRRKFGTHGRGIKR